MLNISNLSVHFTGEYLFKDVQFIVADNDKIGLVGKNGVGKTTLLRILAKELAPQSGNIVITEGHKIGYLPQEMKLESHETVFNEVINAIVEKKQLDAEISALQSAIENETDFKSKDYLRRIDRLEQLNRQYNYLDFNRIEANSEKILLGLGFEKEDFSRPVSQFSYGWQMRIELAKILLRKTEILLLDEPTNHLDIESIQWLENFLQAYSGAIVMVSHDKAFLDNICTRTLEITHKNIEDYNCNYSTYITRRVERVEHQKQMFANQQKERAEIERFIEQFRYKPTKAKQVQSRIKMLEKMDIIEVDEIDVSHIHFVFPSAPPCDKVAFDLKDLVLSFDGKKNVLNQIDLTILRGEKIALVGKNGEGKTTLVRILTGELQPTDGIFSRGKIVKIGYFSQNHNQFLDLKKTVFQTIDDVAVGEMRTKVREILGSFLFSNSDIEKPVSVLSGGEKSRLVLAKLLLEPYNVLILDEPTNHLDMTSKDVLKNALLKYNGTLLIVSHDRDFLQGLTDKVIVLKNGKTKEYIGDIQYYLEQTKASSLIEKASPVIKNEKIKDFSENKLSWQEQKQKESILRKLSKQIENQENEISAYEQQLSVLIHQMTENQNDNNVYIQYNQIETALNRAIAEWENLCVELENIQNQ